MVYSIRLFNQSDMSFLWEMLYQSIHLPEGQQPLSREIVNDPNIAKYLKNWGGNNDHALIAMDGENKPLGSLDSVIN